MSYTSRRRKRQIRKHVKQQRAADLRIDRFLRGHHEPQAVGLMGRDSDVSTGAPSTMTRG